MKRASLLSLLLLSYARQAVAGLDTLGPEGINSLVTGLTGSGVPIGQVETFRPGKPLYDTDPMNYASNTVPSGVYFQTDGGFDAMDSANIFDHATSVAAMMIGQDHSVTGRNAADYAANRGVAPSAILVSAAGSSALDQEKYALTLNRLAIINGGTVTAINMSFALKLTSGVSDGNSYLTQFVDWSARQHDVLYVAAWGNESNSDYQRTPSDTFNGIVVGASEKPSGESTWRQYSNFVNAPTGLSSSDALQIDLLAPGRDVRRIVGNDLSTLDFGTSFSAPLVTGTVALLQQYALQNSLPTNARKHEVMKAVLMNSADKIAGIQGSIRTAIDREGLDWKQSEAFNNPSIPLDNQMGAGLLNAGRAVTQLAPGEFNPGTVPLIGWDLGNYPGAFQTTEYTFNQSMGANQAISITLAYDRPVFCTCETTFTEGEQFFTLDFPNLDVYLEKLDGTVVASSTSTDLTVEHIFTDALPAGQYKIVVKWESGFGGDPGRYALAWWYGNGPPKPGDFNSDGKVDGADYVLWRKDSASYGGAGGYDTWRTNYGATSGSGAGSGIASVPEPCTMFLLTLAIPICFQRARRISLCPRSAKPCAAWSRR
jgi:hypothetical protein